MCSVFSTDLNRVVIAVAAKKISDHSQAVLYVAVISVYRCLVPVLVMVFYHAQTMFIYNILFSLTR